MSRQYCTVYLENAERSEFGELVSIIKNFPFNFVQENGFEFKIEKKKTVFTA